MTELDAARVDRLVQALLRARATFADTEKAMRMLHRDLVADAMYIAGEDIENTLADLALWQKK